MSTSRRSTNERGVMSRLVQDVMQQDLKEYRFRTTPVTKIFAWAITTIVFIIIVSMLNRDYHKSKATRIEYSEKDGNVSINFSVPGMHPPVYVYYELSNYYQNHRRYVRSRNDDQLAGEIVDSAKALEDCEPLLNGPEKLSGAADFYNPCGLIAASWFSDSFELNRGPQSINIDRSGISWEGDREERFQRPEEYVGQYPSDALGRWSVDTFEDESFMVWMRAAGLPRFRKLYGIITEELTKDHTYTVHISNNFRVDSFDGKKAIVFATAGEYTGGPNAMLLGLAAVCLAASLAMMLIRIAFLFLRFNPACAALLGQQSNPLLDHQRTMREM
eukprot:TRINITY_DN3182_c1_g1_i1.p1 TRINITY_DN3182_c1_g1~~TRINITY_DN3182_c1_g1_i1.p1  ORF type:complete len:331 (+),score=69.49 TRINITY_DN3182_c1_g1_i1:45-1037(+)